MAAAAGQKRAFSSDTHSGTHVLRRRTCPAARRKLSIKRQVATARTTSSDLARDSERTHAGHSREVQATARAASRVSALVHSISGTRTSSSKPAGERSASWRPNLVASKPGGVNADKRGRATYMYRCACACACACTSHGTHARTRPAPLQPPARPKTRPDRPILPGLLCADPPRRQIRRRIHFRGPRRLPSSPRII